MEVQSVFELEKEYTPKWNGNRKAKDGFKVIIQRLTPVEKSSCFVLNVNGKTEADLGRFVSLGVPRFVGQLKFNSREIKNGADVCNTPGLDELFAELSQEVVIYNRTPDLKNS